MPLKGSFHGVGPGGLRVEEGRVGCS